jgi:hypothetical protein
MKDKNIEMTNYGTPLNYTAIESSLEQTQIENKK